MESTSFPKEKIKILLLENIHPKGIEIFEKSGYRQIETINSALEPKELQEKIKNVHILGIRSKTQVDAKTLGKAQKLWALACFCIGTNNVNMQAAAQGGIAVFNSPFSNTRSVAELVLGHIIYLLRKIPQKNKAAHQGLWLKESKNCYEARGKTLGIIGYGHIGSQVSVLAEALGMRVIFYDIEPKLTMGNASACHSLAELLPQADIISLHVPETTETKGMIAAEQFQQMKQGAALINLSRGDVVNLDDLKVYLENKHLHGAAIDVFPSEPESVKEPFICTLQGMDNVVLSPHIGGSTEEAQENIGIDAANKLLQFLETGNTVASLSLPELSLPKQRNAYRFLHVHENKPGVLSAINTVMANNKVNILGQYLQTNRQLGYVVLDVDKQTSPEVLKELKKIKHTLKARSLY